MKTLPLLIAVFALFVGSAGAAEISYTATGSDSNTGGVGRIDLRVPAFDTLRPEIPDAAYLMGVNIEIAANGLGAAAVWQTDNADAFTVNAIGSIQWVLWTHAVGGESLYSSQPLSIPSIPGFASFGGLSNFSTTDANLAAYDRSLLLGPEVRFNLEGHAFMTLLAPFPAQDSGFMGFATVDMIGANATAKVTYTYGVPDGGSTLPLLLAGLVSCRLMRRPKI
ncbi:MAG: hypothetical protein V4675_21975 [Verrucomicrobiota bacterium]